MTEIISHQLFLYIFMPISYALVGWLTNVLALKMTFYPLKFIGIPPYLGWQGIIPRKAHKMALHSVNIITNKLIGVHDISLRIHPKKVQDKLGPILLHTIENIFENIIHEFNVDVVSLLPPNVKKRIYENIRKDADKTVQEIVKSFQGNVDQLFSIENLVIRHLSGDNVKLMVEMFETVGWQEFRFIKLSGLIFGFLLGTIQSVFWMLYPIWWTLPIQGALVGYITNWLALYLIFRPLKEKKIAFFRYQGLFLKRQEEVCRNYADIVSNKILTGKNILLEILHGYAANKMMHLIQESVTRSVDASMYSIKPLMSFINRKKFDMARNYTISHMIDIIPESAKILESYLDETLEIRNTIYTKMNSLPPKDFEFILRSGFQEDEFLLFLVGAIIGSLVGMGQAFYIGF